LNAKHPNDLGVHQGQKVRGNFRRYRFDLFCSFSSHFILEL